MKRALRRDNGHIQAFHASMGAPQGEKGVCTGCGRGEWALLLSGLKRGEVGVQRSVTKLNPMWHPSPNSVFTYKTLNLDTGPSNWNNIHAGDLVLYITIMVKQWLVSSELSSNFMVSPVLLVRSWKSSSSWCFLKGLPLGADPQEGRHLPHIGLAAGLLPRLPSGLKSTAWEATNVT